MRAELRRPAALLLAGTAGGVAVWVVLSAGGRSVRPWLVIVLAVAAAAVLVVLDATIARLPPLLVPRPAALRTPTDRERGGVLRVARALDAAMTDADRFGTRVRPTLVRLAEHRLRHHHAVDLWSDPDHARTLLGDSLWQMMSSAPPTPPTRRQLADWLARIEAL